MESSKSAEILDACAAASVRARSYLFVPANRLDRIAKARASGADAVIVDLEDAVSLDAKDTARAALANVLNPARPVIVRINSAKTRWFTDDLRLCRTPGVGAIMLPKAESSAELREAASSVGRAIPLLPLIETARGLWNVLEIAQTPGVQRLVFGALDFQLDLGLMGGGQEELVPFRAQLVLASRVASIIPPVDGPTTAVDDAEAIRSDALRARRAGFGAKLCIHPKQVGWVNESFRPSHDEIAWATRVLAAARGAQGEAFAVEGKMVDRPVVALAESILAQSEERRDKES